MDYSDSEGTIRQRIILLLKNSDRPLTVDEIAAEIGIENPRDVYEHLEHVAKTVRRQSSNRMRLVMVPPRCANCGYVFKDLDKPRKPSRCPRCKSERIEPPRFKIVEI